jgi:hypothetical protein
MSFTCSLFVFAHSEAGAKEEKGPRLETETGNWELATKRTVLSESPHAPTLGR